MTKSEWRQIDEGDTRKEVNAEVGYRGRVTSTSEGHDGSLHVWVNYRQCKRDGTPARTWNTVSVNFDNYSSNDDWEPHGPLRAFYIGSWYSL